MYLHGVWCCGPSLGMRLEFTSMPTPILITALITPNINKGSLPPAILQRRGWSSCARAKYDDPYQFS